jgi:DNA-binding GntR family transcriptional regulator
MIVAPLTKDDANQLYMIIGHLEGIAGRGAAQMPEKERNDLIKQLKVINDKLLAIADGDGPPGEIFDLDRNFHRLIVDSGAGARLATVQEHERIIEGVHAGDPDAVETALQYNWIKGSERLGHVIDIFGERGSW